MSILREIPIDLDHDGSSLNYQEWIFLIELRDIMGHLRREEWSQAWSAADMLLLDPELPLLVRARTLMARSTALDGASVYRARLAFDLIDIDLRQQASEEGFRFPNEQLTLAKRNLDAAIAEEAANQTASASEGEETGHVDVSRTNGEEEWEDTDNDSSESEDTEMPDADSEGLNMTPKGTALTLDAGHPVIPSPSTPGHEEAGETPSSHRGYPTPHASSQSGPNTPRFDTFTPKQSGLPSPASLLRPRQGPDSQSTQSDMDVE